MEKIPSVSSAEFVGIISDHERAEGIVIRRAGETPKRGTLIRFCKCKNGQDAAIYAFLGIEERALIGVDYLTQCPRLLCWLKDEDIELHLNAQH